MTTRKYPTHILFADWQGMKEMLIAGATWLEKHVPVVNALNVFPVPDGDTGTNMFLTMQACIQEMESLTEHTVSAVMHAAAHGASSHCMQVTGTSASMIPTTCRRMAAVGGIHPA